MCGLFFGWDLEVVGPSALRWMAGSVSDGKAVGDCTFVVADGRRGSGYCPVCGFVGGWLLRCRKSAKTAVKNPELAPASLKQLDFLQQRRFPPSKKRTPPAEAEPASILSLGCAFRPERRKQSYRGTEAGAVAPCPAYCIMQKFKSAKSIILNIVEYRKLDRQRVTFVTCVAYAIRQ